MKACTARARRRPRNLLYLVIKDHPFSDGNKRIGSFLFMLYLKQESIDHHLNPQALTALALLIAESAPASMSRRICVELYEEISRLRPRWHHGHDDGGPMKVIMTGSASDPVEWQHHIRSKGRREDLAKRFRNPSDPFKLVIVRDMWLTGFDAPCLHTMYVDKPMRGHGLMQAIARVNRVFRDKPGGLVVDYLGLADELQERARHVHRERRQGRDGARPSGSGGRDAREARDVLRLVPRVRLVAVDRPARRQSGSACCPQAQEHVLAQDDGKDRFVGAVRRAVPGIRARCAARGGDAHSRRRGVLPGGPVRAREACGLGQAARGGARPRHASDRLARSRVRRGGRHLRRGRSEEARHLDPLRRVPCRGARDAAAQPGRRAAAEAPGRRDQDAPRASNVVQARSFAEMLEKAIRRYQNRAIETAQVIEELIELARDMREAERRGEDLGLSDDELAFYDALETNDSAVKVLGDDTLRDIARELVDHGPQQRHHRLDDARQRAREAAGARQADSAEARLPARQAGEGDADRAGAGGSAQRRVGRLKSLRGGILHHDGARFRGNIRG